MLRLPTFRYLRPESVEQAVAWRTDGGPEAAFVAGGTDLYPNMKRRQQTPPIVIGLGRIPELRGISGDSDTGARVGATTTLTRVCEDPFLVEHYPEVSRAARTISTPLLRNMGTIGGNVLLDTRCNYYDQTYEWRRSIDFCMKKEGTICWVAPSSPRCWAVQSSDLVPLLCAIGGSVRLVSPRGERELAFRDLYRDDGIDYLNKQPDELLTDLRLPARDGWRATYWKLRRREAFDFPVLGVAACLRLDGDVVREAHLYLGGVGSWPIEATGACDVLVGRRLDEETIQAAAAQAYRPAKPLDNTDFHMTWRKHMVRRYVEGALRELSGDGAAPRD